MPNPLSRVQMLERDLVTAEERLEREKANHSDTASQRDFYKIERDSVQGVLYESDSRCAWLGLQYGRARDALYILEPYFRVNDGGLRCSRCHTLVELSARHTADCWFSVLNQEGV